MSSAMETFSLDQLAADGDEGIELGGIRRVFKNDTAYAVEVTKQDLSVSENGYYVAKFGLGAINAKGEVTNGDTVTMCLPDFPAETVSSINPEKLDQLKQMWGQRFHNFLRALAPETYAVYASSSKQNGKWKFFDAEGHEMTGAEKKSRETLMGKAVIGTAKKVTAGKMSFVGKRFYFVRTSDKKNPDKTYDNFWSVAPDKYPLAEV